MEPNQTPIEPNFSTNVTNQSKLAEVIAPLHRVTPVSKILAAVVMIVLPFAGFWVGLNFTNENQSPVQAPIVVVPADELIKQITITESELDEKSIVIYTVKESKVRGEGRSYPILALYKEYKGVTPVKFATVGAVGEYPAEFAVSPDSKKVAVNLQSKLILINVETGEQETVYTPKFAVGGRMAFSPDSTQLAFVDGSYNPLNDYAILYTYDVLNKELTEQVKGGATDFIDVNSWRPDNVLLVSVTPQKGCAQSSFTLFNLRNKSLSTLPEVKFSNRSIDGQYVVQTVDSIRPKVCEDEKSMCSGLVYYFDTQMSVSDPVNNSTVGNFGDGIQAVEFVALSPQADKVVYSIGSLPLTKEQCHNNAENISYELKDFKTGATEKVNDLSTKLSEWGITLVNKDSSNRDIEVITPKYTIYKQ